MSWEEVSACCVSDATFSSSAMQRVYGRRASRSALTPMPYVDRIDPAGSRSVPGPTRTGVVGLTALLTQIVIIAAIGNQWVTDRIFDSILRDNTDFSRDFKQALIVFNWRFAPQHADQHSW